MPENGDARKGEREIERKSAWKRMCVPDGCVSMRVCAKGRARESEKRCYGFSLISLKEGKKSIILVDLYHTVVFSSV